MTEPPSRRPAHPCIARRCGHAIEAHVRTPELESSGETVLWCSACRRHEVRAPSRLWPGRRSPAGLYRALPLNAP